MYALPLMGGQVSSLGHFPFPFPLGITTQLPCEMLLLLPYIVGFAAALLEFEEDHIAVSAQKLHNFFLPWGQGEVHVL